jgi:hypothetical protein
MARRKLKGSKVLNAAILEVVENQLLEGNPPETQQTYDRLIKAGYSDKETRDLIGCVVSSEIFEVLKKKEPYDRDRFISALKRLPTLPWEK